MSPSRECRECRDIFFPEKDETICSECWQRAIEIYNQAVQQEAQELQLQKIYVQGWGL